ncbi:hypothetical protein CC80DRAFT_489604 [Byssothecium circinans]|uniref:Zn(2)-C6 fungal-type domain-containing protein n=1 Tax=Byssothecium circinans TaxID=147558 RepID=A0A6A5U9G5_9PLEO|nr:hypothetical protein CC80DRAFT_489604 [Byssothecium circinans]
MDMQPQKDRSAISCTECQRRKQKCSREWPCNHCQVRKVPHLCQFGARKAQLLSSTELASQEKRSITANDSKGLKRSLDELGGIDAPEVEPDGDQRDGLKMWGYMPGHLHYNLSRGINRDDRNSKSPSEEAADDVENALHVVPPRSITDAFVNHFLTVVNYRYNAIYGPTFTEKYVQWWSDRANSRRLSPEFTCLLLRVLSYSVQYLSPSLRKMIEFELACSSQDLSERFSAAAEKLSKAFPPSSTSIERVQEQFLKGAWLKSESRMVESWHVLGHTIREAQELGIDKETGSEDISEFDKEIRRRLWALLFIWDWQMSAWLGRPHLIDQKDLSFVFPNLRLDASATESNQLSPFAHVALQARLARRIAPIMVDVQVHSDCSTDQVSAILDEVHRFVDDLPPVFGLTDTDYSLDEAHPYYVFQRLQLHVVIYMTMLDFLKPFLARDPRDPQAPSDAEFREKGVELGLKLLVVARQMFDHEFPINAKFHLVVFCIFDTATILCSAIIHDVEVVLPHREKVMDAVESALDMLHQLSLTTKIGASSYRFLFKLVQASRVLSRHPPIAKRHRKNGISDRKQSTTKDSLPTLAPIPPTEAAPPVLETAIYPTDNVPVSLTMPIPEVPTTDDLGFELDHFMAQNPFPGSQPLEMGGMEAIWDWENLNLDFLGQGLVWEQQ